MKIGPYEVLGELGRGGMGVVYRARRADLDREFALKVLAAPDGSVPEAETRARFLREARLAARLAGIPGIVAVHDVGEGFVASDATNGQADGRPAFGAAPAARPVLYLAMDRIDGSPLEDRIASGDLPAPEAVRIVEEAARAIARAHEAGVLHRDLKPSNILVDQAGRAWVTDFGLARPVALDAETARLTRSGAMLGTPAYMAPEQARGEAVDARTDVYGLGATLYEALAGDPPFAADSLHRIVTALLRDPPPPLRSRVTDLSRDLEAVVLGCLAKTPEARYPTAGALAEDLARVRAGQPVRGPAGRGARRRVGTLAAGLAVAALAGVVGTWAVARPRVAPTPDTPIADPAQTARAAAVFFPLVTATREPMMRLQDHFHGVLLPAEALATNLEAVARAVAEASARDGTVRAPASWLALARFYAGDAAPLPDGSDALAAGDPFPALLLAQAHLEGYVEFMTLPGFAFRTDGVRVGNFDEGDPARAARLGAAAAVAAAARAPGWAALPQADAYVRFAAGVQALAGAAPERAAAALAEVGDDALLGPLADMLGGLAAFAAGRFAESADASARAARRGWVHASAWAGIAHLAVAEADVAAGRDPRPRDGQARAALDAALERDPRWVNGRVSRAAALQRAAERAQARGEDPVPAWRAAIADLDAAVAESPTRVGDRMRAAQVRRRVADWLDDRREAPQPECDAALAALADPAVAATDPDDTRVMRIRLYRLRARHADRRGGDPEPDAALALAELDALLAAGFHPAGGHFTKASIRLEQAEWMARRGADPRARLAAAETAVDAALALAPEDLPALALLGSIGEDRGKAEVERGGDPRPAFGRALDAYRTAVRLVPEEPANWGLASRVAVALAVWLEGRGEDAGPACTEALAWAESGLARCPDHPGLVSQRLKALRMLAEATPQETRAAALAAAAEAADAAVASRPDEPFRRRERADIRIAQGEVAARNGEDPTAFRRGAVADLDAVLAVRPRDVHALRTRATTRQELAEAAAAEGADVRADLADVLADHEAAAALEAPDAVGRQNRAWTLWLASQAAAAAGEDPGPLRLAALAEFDAVIASGFSHVAVHHNRAVVLEGLGRLDEAIAACEAGLRVAPNAADVRRHLAELRAAAGR